MRSVWCQNIIIETDLISLFTSGIFTTPWHALHFQNAACLSRDVIIMMVRDVNSMMVPEFIIMMAYDIMPDMEWEDVLASTPLLEVSTSFSFLMKMFLIFFTIDVYQCCPRALKDWILLSKQNFHRVDCN